MNKITVIGLGFVGLTTAAFFASKGVKVYGVDNVREKIELIKAKKIPFFEPSLYNIVKKTISSSKLVIKEDLDSSLEDSKFIFICIGTPLGPNGKVDLKDIIQISKDIGQILRTTTDYKLICIKSTVPPTTTENIIINKIEKTASKSVYKDFGISVFPEFLREGSAVSDMTQPHKIVIGANDPKSASLLHKLLTNIYGEKAKIMTTNIISAELIKYANNSFLATKISFINTIANICSLLPRADVDMIAKAIGMDPRIGNQFLVAGPGFGGSCLPKDLSGFIDYCQNNGYDPILLKATAQVNKFQIEFILELLRERLRTLEDKSICILGTAFKKDTDDVRESVSINLIRELKKSAAIVSVHDPKALANTRKIFGNSIRYHVSLKEAITNSDSLILMTDWDEYKKISQKEILRNRKDRSLLIVDTRRILKIKKTGMIDYVALGRNTPISTFE